MHVRRTDYVQRGWALPYSYYDEALETLLPAGGDVWIVTDDPHDPFLRKFSDWEPKFFRGTALETMLFMSRSPQLVMSHGDFATFAAIRRAGDLNFIRVDFGDVRARGTSSKNSLRMGRTDPGFDGATADEWHLKHCAVIRRRTGVEFKPRRLAAAL